MRNRDVSLQALLACGLQLTFQSLPTAIATSSVAGALVQNAAVAEESQPKLHKEWFGARSVGQSKYIYFGSGTTVIGVDPVTGEEVIKFDYPSARYDTKYPTPLGDSLIVCPTGGKLTSLSPKEGKPLWTADFTSYMYKLGPDGALYAIDNESVLHKLDLATGKEIASLKLPSSWLESEFVTLPEGKVLWSCKRDPSAIWIIDTKSGAAATDAKPVFTDPEYLSQVLVDKDRAYFATSKAVVAAEYPSFKSVWTFPFAEYPGISQPPVADDTSVYAQNGDGAVFAFEKVTGKKRWTFTPEAESRDVGLLIAGGRLFSATDDGVLQAIDAATGKPLWKYDNRRFREAPLLNGELVVFGGKHLFALEQATGKPKWTRESQFAMFNDEGTQIIPALKPEPEPERPTAATYDKQLEDIEKKDGPESPKLVPVLYQKAVIFLLDEKHKDAIPVYERARLIAEKTNTMDGYLHFMQQLGDCYLAVKDFPHASELFAKLVKYPGAENAGGSPIEFRLADAYQGQGKYVQAGAVLLTTLQRVDRPLGSAEHYLNDPGNIPGSVPTAMSNLEQTLSLLAKNCQLQGDDAKAEAYYLRAIALADAWYRSGFLTRRAELRESLAPLLRKKNQEAQAVALEVEAKRLRAEEAAADKKHEESRKRQDASQ